MVSSRCTEIYFYKGSEKDFLAINDATYPFGKLLRTFLPQSLRVWPSHFISQKYNSKPYMIP